MIVNDKMQKNYHYEYDAPIGSNYATDFKPDITPPEMLKLGIFEGHYLNDCQNEFPKEWFLNAKLSYSKPNAELNFFKIKSRMSLQEWQNRGWIVAPDPRGWFQWYCRYYMGRRLPKIDHWQINRWKKFKRHVIQIQQNCLPMDLDCRRKQRQALLQWAYDPFF